MPHPATVYRCKLSVKPAAPTLSMEIDIFIEEIEFFNNLGHLEYRKVVVEMENMEENMNDFEH